MTILIAFIAGALCATALILLLRRGEAGRALPQLAELTQAVQQLRLDGRGDSGELRGLLQGLSDTQAQIARQTGQLAEALRRPGVRGQWGETTLRQVVEAAGLAEHFDFATQAQLADDGESGGARPDLVVHLPGGGSLPVDAKVPLDAYLDAAAAEEPVTRERALDRHVAHVREKVRELAGKQYWSRFERAPEMVVMFIGSEAAFAAAAQRDPQLLQEAARQRVVIATPATMLALLQVVALGWREHALSENAETVRRLATELVKRLATFAKHMSQTSRALEQATRAHNSAVGSLESRVLVTARRLDELGIPGELPEVERVATVARLPAAAAEDDRSAGQDAVRPDQPAGECKVVRRSSS
jgi:DNA recombination protein RmuC